MKTIFGLTILLLFSCYVNAQKKKVVFVCEHGAAKSVIAANYFNQLATERSLNYEAVCRATLPDSTLTPATRAGLKSDHITPNVNPQKLALTDTVNVQRIILFTPLPKGYETLIPIEDWSGVQNIDAPYSQRKDAIIKKLNILLDSLEKRN
jgi:hypothetical protein